MYFSVRILGIQKMTNRLGFNAIPNTNFAFFGSKFYKNQLLQTPISTVLISFFDTYSLRSEYVGGPRFVFQDHKIILRNLCPFIL